MQCHTKVGSITANLKVKNILHYLKLARQKPWRGFSMCMTPLRQVRYDVILGIYILKYLGLNLKLSDNVIEANDGTFKGSTAPIVDLGTYELKY